MRALVLVMSLALATGAGAQPFATPEPESEPTPTARVSTPKALPDECLAPVEISRVDGKDVNAPPAGLVIEPGRHSFNGRALLDSRRCRQLAVDTRIPTAADLVIDVEAGKVYHIAYDRSRPDPQDWRLVVWKVEDLPLGEGAEPAGGDFPGPGSADNQGETGPVQ